MKKITTYTIGLLLLICFFIPQALAKESKEAKGLKYSIMVSKFENKSNWSGKFNLAQTYGAILTDALQKTGRFIVIGEKDMRVEAMMEQDLGESGRMAGGKKTPEKGQMTPAQMLVKGEITHFQASTGGGKGGINIGGVSLNMGKDTAEINTTIYVVDSTTAQVTASKSVKASAEKSKLGVGFSDRDFGANVEKVKKTNVGQAIQKSVDKAVKFLLEQLDTIPWSGSVVLVKGDKVYINRGSREGVEKGQSFVVGEAVELRDPDTGELLDTSVETVAELKVIQVKEKIAIAKVVSGKDKIQKGMTVTPP